MEDNSNISSSMLSLVSEFVSLQLEDSPAAVRMIEEARETCGYEKSQSLKAAQKKLASNIEILSRMDLS